jgi:hypothetical protein
LSNELISQPVYIYVPFLVDEVVMVDSMYEDNVMNPTISNSTEYTLSSDIFNGVVVPLNMQDIDNQGYSIGKHNSMSVQYVNRRSINGMYTFTVHSLTAVSFVESYVILLQFVNNEYTGGIVDNII